MCLLLMIGLVVYAIYLAIAAFFQTALLLLPWTVTATVLGGVAAGGLARLLARSRGARGAVAWVGTIALTVGFGYLGFVLVPPTPPPPRPPEKDLVKVLTELPKPAVTKEDFATTLPIHLALSGTIGGAMAAAIVAGRGRKSQVLPPDQPSPRPV